MQILHLDLKLVGENYAELRYFFDNANQYQRRSLPLEAIAEVIELAETGYYSPHESIILRSRLSVDDYTITGRKLFNWLDGSDRFLQQAIDQYWREGIVLAIAASAKLAHLPWELLHDGNNFLVARMPAVVPVRWVSSDTKKLSIEGEPANRALNVLFMATSPLGVEPVLDFEAEEGRILEATARHKIGLTVEESGCLTELGYLVADYDRGYFDIFHLTGHATLSDGQPRFITETETGESYLASAKDIAKALKSRIPKLIFLSGCRTGQLGNSGAVPSMAQELLNLGAKAVLGWGQKVLDHEAAIAAAALYEALSRGDELTEAIAHTYQALIENQARDWHLLRLYAESLHKHAAEVLYRFWWEEGEEGESLRGEQGLEIHRLALLGKAEKIATEMAVALTSQGHNQSLFKEVVQLCKLTLGVAENYRILHQLARSEQELGEVSQAQEHYQQALNNCPQENEKEKAAIIHNLATLKANQGHIKEALALHKQSEIIFERIPYDPGKAGSLHCQGILEAKQGHIEEAITLHEQSKVIFDSIGCDQGKAGKAAALHCLGMCKAAQTKVEEAITLYQESLVLFESLGNDQGKAATLHELATLKANMEEIDQAIALYQESLTLSGSIGYVQGKAMTLAMLGQLLANKKGDFDTARDYLQQSLEILQRLESPDAEIARLAIARVQQMAQKRE